MDQETAVKKLIEDIKLQRPISNDFEKLISNYLTLAIGVGFDLGKKQRAHGKPILQIKAGKVIKRWEDAISAANHFHVNKSTIGKAIKNKRECKGFNWEFEK